MLAKGGGVVSPSLTKFSNVVHSDILIDCHYDLVEGIVLTR